MKHIVALTLALLIVGVQSLAADPLMKYSYFDAAYQWSHIDQPGLDDANGLDTKLSYVVMDNIAFEGGYNYLNTQFAQSTADIDVSEFKYGIAGWHSFCQGFDLVGRVGGIHDEVSGDVAYDRQDGVYAGGGIRGLLTDTIEGNFDVLYQHIESFNGWTYTATTLFTLDEDMALKTSVGLTDDSDVILTGGLRFTL